MGRSLIQIFSVFLFACMATVARCEVDSVMKAIRSLPADTVRLSELEKWMRKTIDTPDELIIIDTLLVEAERQGSVEYQAIAYRNRVRHYYNADNLEMAKTVAGPAIPFFRKNKLYSRLFDVEGMLITLYTNRQEYEFSIQKGNEMYKEAESLRNSDGVVSACYVLAYACYASGRYQDAIDWNRKGLGLVSDPMERQSLMEFYFLMAESALSLSRMNDLHTYLDSVRLQLDECDRLNEEGAESIYSYYWLWLHCRYAYVDLQQGNPERAKENLEAAAKYLDDHSYNIYQDLYYFAWSEYYYLTGEYEKALDEVAKGSVAFQKGFPEIKENPEVYQRFAKIYAGMKNYPLATDHIKRAIQISDSLNNIRFTDQSRQLRTIYDMNKLETEGRERASIIRIQTVLVLALGMTICLLCFFFFRFLRVKHRAAKAALRAQEADQNTSLFLTNMGREVKVFLQEMSALSDLLIRTKEQEKQQEYATTICARNEKAQKVIFDILDVSKIDSGRMQFHYENVDLSEFVEMILYRMKEYAPEKVRVLFDGGEDILLATDSSRLNQILTNLLFYAVTHTGGGNLHLGYEVKEKEVLFYIFGEEWSMPEAEYNNLFDRVVLTTSDLENMHLGMIIGKGLIEGMGGTFSVDYQPEGGTRFEFTILKRILSNNE